MQILSQVLDLIPSPFSIRLAALASQHELVDLEKWLGDNLTTYKDIFFEVIFISYTQKKKRINEDKEKDVNHEFLQALLLLLFFLFLFLKK